MNKLKKVEVFDYSEVVHVLDGIEEENDEITRWKNGVLNAIQNVNETEYNRLISLLE